MQTLTVEHPCGHSKTYQIPGNREAMNKFKTRAENQVCPECWLKKEQTRMDTEVPDRPDLPRMRGVSENQIVYAESVRQKRMGELNTYVQNWNEELALESEGGRMSLERKQKIQKLLEAAEAIKQKSWAPWWLDGKKFTMDQLVYDQAGYINLPWPTRK